MGIIDEVDSVEFSSTMKSQQQFPPPGGSSRTSAAPESLPPAQAKPSGSKINHSKVQAFLQQNSNRLPEPNQSFSGRNAGNHDLEPRVRMQ
jgi:hypothetical protein